LRSHHTGDASRRLAVVRVILLLGFAGLAARAAHLAVVDERGARRGANQTLRILTIAPERGAIFDRNKEALALDIDTPSIYALPSVRNDPKATARRLAPVLGMKTKNLEDRLRERRSFGFLARWVSPEIADRVRELSLPGIGVLNEPRRNYPHRELASRVLGFANIDREGVRGIEQLENDWLSGVARRIPVERDASGRLLVRDSDESFQTSGGDVATTLDAKLQADAESALAAAIEKTGAEGGIVVSMDPHSGEILALAEAPGFDPNHFRKVPFASTRSRAFLDACSARRRRHRSRKHLLLREGEVFHPGDDREGSPSPRGPVSCRHPARVEQHRCREDRFPAGPARTLRMASALWLRLQYRQLNVTAVQLAAAFSALANGGVLPVPRLILARRPPGGEWQREETRAPTRVVSPETAASVMAMLEGVVSGNGTAARAGLRDIEVAGKTGTAVKWDSDAQHYDKNRFTAWFMGAVPARNPRLVIVAALDEPQRPFHTGGAAAAPLFAEVASAQLIQFGIDTIPQQKKLIPEPTTLLALRSPAPQDPPAAAQAVAAPTDDADRELPKIAKLGERVLMPDLTGFSVEQVRKITAKIRLVVEVSGSGWAVSQEPSPGTVMYGRGPVLRVRFSDRMRLTPNTEG